MGEHEIEVAGLVGSYPTCAACGSRNVRREACATWDFPMSEWRLETLSDEAHCAACDGVANLLWKLDTEFRLKRVRRLNDAMRHGQVKCGSIMITPGVRSLGDDALAGISRKVQDFEAFSEENDPYAENDFGSVDHEDQKVFWKIDYFDLALKWHSPDKANPDVTHRVLTIMLAHEY